MTFKMHKCHHRNCKMQVIRWSSCKCSRCGFYFCSDHFQDELQVKGSEKLCQRCQQEIAKEFGRDGFRNTKKRLEMTKAIIEGLIERERIE